MMAFCIVICFYGVLPDTAHTFTDVNGGCIFIVNRQHTYPSEDDGSHSVYKLEFDKEAK